MTGVHYFLCPHRENAIDFLAAVRGVWLSVRARCYCALACAAPVKEKWAKLQGSGRKEWRLESQIRGSAAPDPKLWHEWFQPQVLVVLLLNAVTRPVLLLKMRGGSTTRPHPFPPDNSCVRLYEWITPTQGDRRVRVYVRSVVCRDCVAFCNQPAVHLSLNTCLCAISHKALTSIL